MKTICLLILFSLSFLSTIFGQDTCCNFLIVEIQKKEPDTKIINKLIKKGADINCADSKRHTPLIIASIKGNTEVVKILINSGADVNKSTY